MEHGLTLLLNPASSAEPGTFPRGKHSWINEKEFDFSFRLVGGATSTSETQGKGFSMGNMNNLFHN